jgi:hypothetical protein
MPPPLRSFVIIYQPAQGPAQPLGRSADANTATVAAHDHCDRLRKQGRAGDVRVVRIDAEQTLVLRLPLVSRPTPIPRPSRLAPAQVLVKRHAGWAVAAPLEA